MIRVLIFGLNPGLGGVESFLMNLYRNIDRSKIQFDFVVPGYTCYYSSDIQSLGGKIFYIIPAKDNILLNIRDLLKLLKVCKHTHQIVYFNLSVLYYNIPFIFTSIFRFPLILSHGHSARGKGEKRNIRYFLHCINRIYVANVSDYLFACSKTAGEWVFGKSPVKKGKVSIVPNAIPSDDYIYNREIRLIMRREMGIDNNQFVVGNVGRLTYSKNQTFLLDVFKEIINLEKNAILLLVGEGELRNQLENKIFDLQLCGQVIMTGARSDIPKLLQVMDVLVLPSHYEGLGIVLIEAQASGLKCFASKDVVPNSSNITGLVEYIDLNKSPYQWAEQIVRCSKAYKREDKIKDIKSAGYDVKEMAENFQKLILKS